jgi:hypothetical protein
VQSLKSEVEGVVEPGQQRLVQAKDSATEKGTDPLTAEELEREQEQDEARASTSAGSAHRGASARPAVQQVLEGDVALSEADV